MVKTTVGPSAVHGLGLFAAEPIAQGAVVWQAHPLVDITFTPDQVEELSEPAQEKISQWSYRHASGMYILCTDGAQFMNHSAEPNVVNFDSGTETDVMVAAREIAAGEELTCDYTTFDERARTQGVSF